MGVVSGHVLKLGRQSTGVTQERLAELLDVDVSSVQGWESGRRPLGALPSAQLIRLRMCLVQLGAPASLGGHIADALEADLLLATGVDFGASRLERGVHPLADGVRRRSLMNLVTWPLTGDVPPQLACFRAKRAPRGPAAAHPVLYPDERRQFFDHLMAVVNRRPGAEGALLRRQAAYLLAFDGRVEVNTWLRDERRQAVRRYKDGSLAGHLEMRTASVALASAGDPELLEYFVSGLTTDRQQAVNLNYWAYWIGEIVDDQSSDDFMVDTNPQSWHGARLLEHLTTRMRSDVPHLVLNLSTLHSLIASRPALLASWPRGRRLVADAVEIAGAHPGLNRTGREQIVGLAYAVRIAER